MHEPNAHQPSTSVRYAFCKCLSLLPFVLKNTFFLFCNIHFSNTYYWYPFLKCILKWYFEGNILKFVFLSLIIKKVFLIFSRINIMNERVSIHHRLFHLGHIFEMWGIMNNKVTEGFVVIYSNSNHNNHYLYLSWMHKLQGFSFKNHTPIGYP